MNTSLQSRRTRGGFRGGLIMIVNAVLIVVLLVGVVTRIALGNMLTSAKYQKNMLQRQLTSVASSGTSDILDIDTDTLIAVAKKGGLVENTSPLILHIDSGVAYLGQKSGLR